MVSIPIRAIRYVSRNASILRDEGVDPIDIQPLLGHSNLTGTQHYIEQRAYRLDDAQRSKILASKCP